VTGRSRPYRDISSHSERAEQRRGRLPPRGGL